MSETKSRELAARIRAVLAREEPRLRAITPDAARNPRMPGKWSSVQVLGHLIDSAANNHQRFVRAQVVDHLTLPGYTQNEWVSAQGYAEEPWGDVLDLWAAYNRHLAHVVERMPQAVLAHHVTVAPASGEPGPPMSLEALIEDYLRHVEHHLAQIEARR